LTEGEKKKKKKKIKKDQYQLHSRGRKEKREKGTKNPGPSQLKPTLCIDKKVKRARTMWDRGKKGGGKEKVAARHSMGKRRKEGAPKDEIQKKKKKRKRGDLYRGPTWPRFNAKRRKKGRRGA